MAFKLQPPENIFMASVRTNARSTSPEHRRMALQLKGEVDCRRPAIHQTLQLELTAKTDSAAENTHMHTNPNFLSFFFFLHFN